MTEKAAVDRIDEGVAVLLIGKEEKELAVPVQQLPAGVQAGDWLKVILINGLLKQAELDEAETQRRRKRIKSRLDKLFK